jgi:hypothetical protein
MNQWCRIFLLPNCHESPCSSRHLLSAMAITWSASPSSDRHCHLVIAMALSPLFNCQGQANRARKLGENNPAKMCDIQGWWFVYERILHWLRTIRYISPKYEFAKHSRGYEYNLGICSICPTICQFLRASIHVWASSKHAQSSRSFSASGENHWKSFWAEE